MSNIGHGCPAQAISLAALHLQLAMLSRLPTDETRICVQSALDALRKGEQTDAVMHARKLLPDAQSRLGRRLSRYGPPDVAIQAAM